MYAKVSLWLGLPEIPQFLGSNMFCRRTHDMCICLMVWIFQIFHILGKSSQLTLILFEGVGIPPTSYIRPFASWQKFSSARRASFVSSSGQAQFVPPKSPKIYVIDIYRMPEPNVRTKNIKSIWLSFLLLSLFMYIDISRGYCRNSDKIKCQGENHSK